MLRGIPMQYSSMVAQNGRLLLILSALFAMPGIAATQVGPLVVPDNGYASGASYGKGWHCEFGYRDTREACVETIVPANGYLNSRGNGWKCDRGFRVENEQCARIIVPENGYLAKSSSGAGWTCDRGFKASGDSCQRIKVPANGFLTNSSFGSGWECERGYSVSGTACVAVQLPANAYRVERSYGPDWQCERGYASSDSKTCNKLEVPANAHLIRDGNDWKCNAPYSKEGQLCIL